MILRNTSFGDVGSVLSRHAGNQKTSSADCAAMGGPVGNRRRGGASNGREGASRRRTIPTTPTSLRPLRQWHAADQEIRQRQT